MRLLLIFALSFTLSAQQDNNNANKESTESGNEMMNKVLDALSEKHTMEIINALNKNDVEKLTDCMEDGECKMADFVVGIQLLGKISSDLEKGKEKKMVLQLCDLMEKILHFLKKIPHGNKPIYDLIKVLVKHGPLAELVNELSEEHTLEIIDALTTKEIGKLINIGKGPISIFALISIGKKITPIIKKANGGKGVPKLISIFTAGGDGNTENSNQKLEKIMNALSEEHTMKMVNALEANEVEKLTDCLEHECTTADSVKILEKMLNVLKGLSHGDKLIYNLIKEIFKHGPLAELLNELSEEYTLEIINALNGKDIDKLMNIGKGEVKKSEIISIGKKIIPIIKKVKDDKGVSILMRLFTDDEDEKTDLPYHQLVPGGLHPGMSVYMQGTVPRHRNRTWVNFQLDFACGHHKEADVPLHLTPHINAETFGLNTFQAGSFRIDFAIGKFEEGDILLHFNPRINQGIVVLNSYESRSWRKEDRYTKPLQKGENFEIIFIVNEAEYQVLLNGSPLCKFEHRISPQFVKFVNFHGHLTLQSLTIVREQIVGNMLLTGSAVYYPPEPYTGNIPGGLGTSRTITVRGFILKDAKSFVINLKAGQNIALHLNSRMKPRRYVVRNTYLKGSWGDEENDLPFNPFHFGQYFEVSICCDKEKFKVYTSGRHLFNFNHRYATIQRIRTLEIKGDVTISYIKY